MLVHAPCRLVNAEMSILTNCIDKEKYNFLNVCKKGQASNNYPLYRNSSARLNETASPK